MLKISAKSEQFSPLGVKGLKYPCDYGTDNYNPICPGINNETPHATRAFVLTQLSSSQKPFT
jgi:hypothetical protein